MTDRDDDFSKEESSESNHTEGASDQAPGETFEGEDSQADSDADSSTINPGQAETESGPETGSEAEAASADEPTAQKSDEDGIQEIWPQLRQLLVFQVKLYVDALRDLLMSPLSIVVFIVDLVQRNTGKDTLFQSLLDFGRKTERAINLFNQHDHEDEDATNIDSIFAQVEEGIMREYQDGSVSAGARDSIEKSLNKLREKVDEFQQNNKDDDPTPKN